MMIRAIIKFMEKTPLYLWGEDDFYLYTRVCEKMCIPVNQDIAEYFERRITEKELSFE